MPFHEGAPAVDKKGRWGGDRVGKRKLRSHGFKCGSFRGIKGRKE